mgnify:CR=1 FL=1
MYAKIIYSFFLVMFVGIFVSDYIMISTNPLRNKNKK